MVGQSEAGVVGQRSDWLVAQHVPQDNCRAASEAVSATEDNMFAVVQHATGSTQLVLAHLQRSTGVEVPDLQQQQQ